MADNKQEINTDRMVDLATSAFYAAVGAADVVVTQAAKSYESMVSQARQRRERRLEHAAAMRDRMTDLPAAARGFPDQAREQFEDLARRGREAVARARGEFSDAFGAPADQPAARPAAAEDPTAEEWSAQTPTATADPFDRPTDTGPETDATFTTPATPRARRVEEDVVPAPAEDPFDVTGVDSPDPAAAETGDWIDEGAGEVHPESSGTEFNGTEFNGTGSGETDDGRPDER